MAFGALEIGKKALLAQRFGLDITSNNIANANTEGYSRRDAQFSQAMPNFKFGQFQGQGVLVDKLRTFREEFFDREIRNTISRRAMFEQDDLVMQRIEAMLAEPTDANIVDDITRFLKQFEELSLKPEDVGLRENIIELARTIVDKFNYISGTLDDTRSELGRDIVATVDTANNLIQKVVEFNTASAAGQSLPDNESQTLIDEREKALEELSEIADISITENDHGTINVFMNGINIVTKTIGSKLAVQENVNDQTGEVTFRLTKVDNNNNTVNTLNPDGGELKSLIHHYNETLDGLDSSGNYSPMKDLNLLMQTLVEKVNDISEDGYGLDDLDGDPPGREFFEIDANGGYYRMTLSADIDGNPRGIPLSATPGTPGNSEIARRIARLADDQTFLENSTYVEYYAAFLGKLGSARQTVTNGLENSTIVNEQLENQRESIIGVNMDEEAINLVKFQRAFDAASRIVTATNEMLSQIINLGR